jgi:hypothetical protein
LGWVGFSVITNARKKRKDDTQLADSQTNLRTNAARLVQEVEQAILSEKTSVGPVAARLAALATVNTKALNVYERAKGLITNHTEEVQTMLNEVANIRSSLKQVVGQDYTSPSPTQRVDTSAVSGAALPVSPYPTSVAQPTHLAPSSVPSQYYAPPQVVHTTVMVDNSLPVTDLLMVDMLLQNSHTRDIEAATQRQREIDLETDRQRADEREVAQQNSFNDNSSNTVDSGNNDSFVDTSSSSTDSGNNDSFDNSSSSTDSGNSDSWASSSDDSSSSSSDSGSSSSD